MPTPESAPDSTLKPESAPIPDQPPTRTAGNTDGIIDNERTLSDLALPELEAQESVEEKNDFAETEKEATHVDLGERPPAESEDMAKKGVHPELLYKPPVVDFRSRLKLNLPPIPRAKLDGYGMVAAMGGLIALLTSPVFMDFLSESPIAHFSDPGVELHITALPSSKLPTGVWISGFRVPFDEEAHVHIPYGGPYKLQVQREGFAEFTTELSFSVGREKKEVDERTLTVTMVPSPFGMLNIGSSRPCGIEISDGVTTWATKTPVRELKVPPSDYLVKFVDPICNDKQFYMPVREGSRSYVVYEFPSNSKDSGYLPTVVPSANPANPVVRQPADTPSNRFFRVLTE